MISYTRRARDTLWCKVLLLDDNHGMSQQIRADFSWWVEKARLRRWRVWL